MTYFEMAQQVAQLTNRANRRWAQFMDLRNLRRPIAPCRRPPAPVQTVLIDIPPYSGESISDMLTEACKGTQFSVVKP